MHSSLEKGIDYSKNNLINSRQVWYLKLSSGLVFWVKPTLRGLIFRFEIIIFFSRHDLHPQTTIKLTFTSSDGHRFDPKENYGDGLGIKTHFSELLSSRWNPNIYSWHLCGFISDPRYQFLVSLWYISCLKGNTWAYLTLKPLENNSGEAEFQI